jgi:hypothetical protein
MRWPPWRNRRLSKHGEALKVAQRHPLIESNHVTRHPKRHSGAARTGLGQVPREKDSGTTKRLAPVAAAHGFGRSLDEVAPKRDI